MTPTDKAAIEGLIAAIAKHRELTQAGSPHALTEAAWNAISMRACEATEALQRLLAGETSRPNPETQAVAKEITQLFVGLDGFPGISASAGQDLEIKVEHAIRKHFRPTQQTEGEWVRVPSRGPTQAMERAYFKALDESGTKNCYPVYMAMLAAAPQAEGEK